MSKITRPDLNIRSFAADANLNERTIFGERTASNDLAQNLNATYHRGWGFVGTTELPSYQDFNAAMFTMSELNAYLYQTGVAEWSAEQEFHRNSITNYQGALYLSLKEDNRGNNPATEQTFWQVLAKQDYFLPTSGGNVDGSLNVKGSLLENGQRVYSANHKPLASTSEVGMVKLSNATDSDSETTAATSKAVKAAVDIAKKNGVLPVGHIYFGLNLDPTSLHLNGQLYSRAAYPELWKYISTKVPQLLVTDSQWLAEKAANNGICNKFSSGDGSTTFRVPQFEYVKGGGLGYQKAGLPNITGEFGTMICSGVSPKDAIYKISAKSPAYDGNKVGFHTRIGLDASQSNPIYGSSNTVDLQAVTGFWQIKAIGEVIDAGRIDTTNMLNQINLLNDRAVMKDTFECNLNGNGYQKLPSGLIIQWGKVDRSINAPANYTVTFPISFPHSCLSINLTPVFTNSPGALGSDAHNGVGKVTNSNMIIRQDNNQNGAYWTAIGY